MEKAEGNAKSWRDCRVLLGITANQPYIDKELMYNVAMLAFPNEYIVKNESKHIKSDSLNRFVEFAMRENMDKVLFLDTDMEFPLDIIPKLISRNVPIVSGLYHLKTHPFCPIAGYNKDIHGTTVRVNREGKPWKYFYSPFPDDQLVEVDWTGIGCLMVDISVFKTIKFPCFYDIWDMKRGARENGHDIVFCDAAREAGFKIYLDTSVQCGHRQRWVVDKPFVDAWHKSNIASIVEDMYKEHGDDRPSHITEKERYKQIGSITKIFEADKRGPKDPLYWDVKFEAYDKKNTIIDRKEVMDRISDIIPDKSTVADIGCGYSSILPHLRGEKDCDCYAYDFSSVAIDLMKKRFGIDGEVVDILKFEPNGVRYDTVVVSHLLEHFDGDDVPKLLTTVSKMTGKQAIFVVPQERPEGLEGVQKRLLEREHKKIYTVPELRKTLKPYFGHIDIQTIKPTRENKKMWVNRHILAVCSQQPEQAEEAKAGQRVSVGEPSS